MQPGYHMKKLVSYSVLILFLLTGCGGEPPPRVVELDGSTAMSGVMAVLREAFQERRPDIRLNCSGSGTGAGIEGVLSGQCGIGLASRELTGEETARGAVGHVIALDGIAVIVHPDNPVRELSTEALADVFTGRITRWTELGGEDRPIAAYGREAGSGTRSAFEAGLGAADRCVYTCEYCSTGDVVGNVANNPNGIGYASLSALDGSVQALRVAGTDCTLETVRQGGYPLRRPFLLVTCGDAPPGEAAGAFLQFAESAAAAPYLALAGAAAPEREGSDETAG